MERPTAGKKIRSLSASDWTDAVAAGQALRAGRMGMDGDVGGFAYPNPPTIKVRNDTGADLPRFSVVAIGDSWVDPSTSSSTLDIFKTGPTCKGTEPATGGEGKFAILLDACLKDGVVDACVSGVTICKLVVGTGEEDYEWADITDGSTETLTVNASRGSARILSKESGVGTKWGIVRLGNRTGASVIKAACFTGHANNKNNDTGVSGPTTYIGALNSKDLLLVPTVETGDSTDVDFFSAAAPSAFEDDWLTILEAGVYRFHWQCRVAWPVLSGAPDGNYGTSGNPVTGASHQHYYPDNTTNFLTETTDPGGIVDVWDQKLYFSICKLRLLWDEPPVGSVEYDDIASQSCVWAEFNTNSNTPEFDLHGLWQRYVAANTTIRVIAYVPDSTIGAPFRLVRTFATLTQLGTSHA